MAFDRKLLDILACPVCKGALAYKVSEQGQETLVCNFDRLAYAVDEGIPVLIEAEASSIPVDGADS
ncbi:Trm112 family protein [Neiella marina]|uniref:UPF0434 protein K0504_04760 n=1 Tax=Neiella holothuriorum TaxID=2870530 RepID=A0ABS7EDC1_9GAMM|nr:Trm112 family protein [Neiella holothuriorum]MBW8190339.1 Trm112 family protein [Neiella holothuriorum]